MFPIINFLLPLLPFPPIRPPPYSLLPPLPNHFIPSGSSSIPSSTCNPLFRLFKVFFIFLMFLIINFLLPLLPFPPIRPSPHSLLPPLPNLSFLRSFLLYPLQLLILYVASWTSFSRSHVSNHHLPLSSSSSSSSFSSNSSHSSSSSFHLPILWFILLKLWFGFIRIGSKWNPIRNYCQSIYLFTQLSSVFSKTIIKIPHLPLSF